MCYRIIFGFVYIDRDAFFQFRLSFTRGHPYKYKQFRNCSLIPTFSERVVNLCNSPPADTINFSSPSRLINPFNASCSKLLLFIGLSAILV